MHFFSLIQQSSQHIYHSALPLSPKSSMFSSMSLPGQTRISEFYGRPDHWGSVVRTITSIPGDFTCMTTIGRGSTAKIAAACDDGTVGIYDSVTGVLRLSLRPELPIQEMTGPPDGSLLICTHIIPPSVTLWDIQTGGLVKTFILEGEAKSTTISLEGRYLACETPGSTISVWETASRPAPWKKFGGNIPCWLAPEELIMVVNGMSVCIRNVATNGPPVHKFDIWGSPRSAVYSHIFNQLIITSCYFDQNPLAILDVKTDTSSILHYTGERPPFIAFSQTTKQVVCGGKAPGLETVDISTGRRTRFDFPAAVTSISTLSNGTVVANVPGSGIQLLSLDQEDASSRQRTPPPLSVYPLDKGRIIAIVPTTNNPVVLLKTASMLRLLSVPTQEDLSVSTVRTIVLCASLKYQVALRWFGEGDKGRLQMWGFSPRHPRWTVPTEDLPSLGSISPAGTRLATFHSGRSRSFVRVWDAHSGTLLAQKSSWQATSNALVEADRGLRPHHITFDSQDRIYLYWDTYREPYVIKTTGDRITCSITYCARQRLGGQVREKYYRLDDGHEWVFCGSQRICWVPPGYIGTDPASHWWVGSSLVMVGRDGILRKLNFQELRPSKKSGGRDLPVAAPTDQVNTARPGAVG